jgi:hypothetical protein
LGSSDIMTESGAIPLQTEELSKTATKRRRKTRSQPQQQHINQSVRVYVNSQNKSSKRYLNVVPLRN